jgi:hypothetical protein
MSLCMRVCPADLVRLCVQHVPVKWRSLTLSTSPSLPFPPLLLDPYHLIIAHATTHFTPFRLSDSG